MSQLRAYAQLVRLPNVFTALADICLGALAAHALPERWLPFGLLLLSSACLYSGGMVLNDLYDFEQDKKERPFRPLPSGRIGRWTALWFGYGLLLVGLLLAFVSGWRSDGLSWTSGDVAGFLAAAVILYDAWLKRTWAGPIGMGSCRFLNVLLGLSIVGSVSGWRDVHLAATVGIYIVGVTWFARTEARTSNQKMLIAAAGVMGAGLLLALPLPLHATEWNRLEPKIGKVLFPYLLVTLGFLVGLPVCQAIVSPTPQRVQVAVKRAIMGLVVLDAVLAIPFAGLWGLLLLMLLIPALYLGRWIYST
jgi:4-hydroxybenzoate polyprenyltransferase